MEVLNPAFKWLEPQYYVKIGAKFYKVIARDFLHPIDKVFPTIAPGTDTGDIEIVELTPARDDEANIFMIGVANKVHVRLKQPPAVARWGTSFLTLGWVDNEISPFEDPNPGTTVCTMKNSPIVLNIFNPTDTALAPIVRFIGYTIKIKEIVEPKELAEVTERWARAEIPELMIERPARVS